jgi:glycosyltransferase involved in cell wall biosynthesis
MADRMTPSPCRMPNQINEATQLPAAETFSRTEPLISVIICTYGRATALKCLLEALDLQTYQRFEVLVIDGNQKPSPAREAIEEYLGRRSAVREVSLVCSEKGLTRQRNVGLRAAKGDLICFLDDDVTFGEDFLLKTARVFERSDMQDVGGITCYDVLNYPSPVTLRWNLRSWLGVMPGLEPGRVDHLGRAVPLSFLGASTGYKEIGWLAGFCMIYRRSAVKGLCFDELLPTYGGEDRDFSMRVHQRHRLMMCGDLQVKHHCTVEGRDDSLARLRESSFGVGRRFGKYARSVRDYLTVIRTFLGDFIIDLTVCIRSPRAGNFAIVFVRLQSSLAGLWSGWTRKDCGEPSIVSLDESSAG